jgi:hypothetical protein
MILASFAASVMMPRIIRVTWFMSIYRQGIVVVVIAGMPRLGGFL